VALDLGEVNDFLERLDLSEIVILILIIIFAILGNAMVLVATWRERSLHQPNKYFVACLAVADLLVGMISVPLRLYQLVNKENGRITSIHLCRFYIWLDVFLETASIYTLTFISFDRYLKISKPLQYKSRMTTSTSLKIIFIIWLIAATYATLAIFPYADSPGILIIYTGECLNKNKIFHTFGAVSAFFLPTAVMLVMYTLIFLVAHKRQKMLRNGGLGQTSNNPNQRSAVLQDLKVIRMLLVVVGVFIFCWGPLFVWVMIFYYNPSVLSLSDSRTLSDIYLKTILHRIVIILPFLNSIFNPLIYACLDQKYKEAFKHLFQRMCQPSSRTREPPQ
jgi:hypothetical protein